MDHSFSLVGPLVNRLQVLVRPPGHTESEGRFRPQKELWENRLLALAILSPGFTGYPKPRVDVSGHRNSEGAEELSSQLKMTPSLPFPSSETTQRGRRGPGLGFPACCALTR